MPRCEACTRVNKVADEANRIVKEVEKALVEEMKIGVFAASCFETYRQQTVREGRHEDETIDEEVDRYLAFGRVGAANYCIHILEVTSHQREIPGHFTEEVNRERIPWSAAIERPGSTLSSNSRSCLKTSPRMPRR